MVNHFQLERIPRPRSCRVQYSLVFLLWVSDPKHEDVLTKTMNLHKPRQASPVPEVAISDCGTYYTTIYIYIYIYTYIYIYISMGHLASSCCCTCLLLLLLHRRKCAAVNTKRPTGDITPEEADG